MPDLSARAREINPSSTLGITARAKKMRAEGCDVVSFAAGEPDFDTPDYIKQAAIAAINEGFTKYTPTSGIPELKKSIQEKFSRDNNLNYESGQIIVSCGAKQCLFNIIQALAQEEDEVIIPSPYWVSYVEMVKFARAKPVVVRTEKANSFKLTARDLRNNISPRTKALILNSPSNPVGYIYGKEELEDIAQVCVKNNIFVISDEIYEKLIYDGKEHSSIAALNKDIYDLTFVVNGVSKSFSMTGWRIGYLAGRKDVVEALSNLQDHSTSNPCSISQKAALCALTTQEDFISRMRSEFEARRNFMLSCLDGMGLKYIRPQGAFYVFCGISQTGLKSWEFAEKFLEKKYVAVIPGGAFGDDDYIRLSFAAGIGEIEKGMQRLKEFLSELK